MDNKKHVSFGGRIVMVGCGSIGQGALPLILRHIDVPRENIIVVTAEERGHKVAQEFGVEFHVSPLTRENYRAVLEPLLRPGDFLVNLSVDVSSIALFELAHEKGAFYLDTCIEPWLGGYTDRSLPPSPSTVYQLIS